MLEFIHISRVLDEIVKKLENLQKATLSKKAPFLNVDQATSYLGLSKQPLYHYTSTGQIPFYKLNDRRIYFEIQDLNNFVLNRKNKNKSNAEIEAEATSKVIADR